MIRPLLAASAMALAMTGLANAETRDYDLSSFEKLDVSAGIEVDFQVGSGQSIAVSNDNGKFDDIIVQVRGDTLVLKRPNRNWAVWNKRERYRVSVTAPRLTSIEASSGAEVTARGLTGDQARISASSGAEVEVTEISAGTIRLASSSGAELDASGTCGHVSADSSSGAEISARQLICQTGDADVSSGAEIDIHASDQVTADASSGGGINVYGGPSETDIDKSSGGSVRIHS